MVFGRKPISWCVAGKNVNIFVADSAWANIMLDYRISGGKIDKRSIDGTGTEWLGETSER